jgi:hypothetical protein
MSSQSLTVERKKLAEASRWSAIDGRPRVSSCPLEIFCGQTGASGLQACHRASARGPFVPGRPSSAIRFS